jgi:hypothetical protein
MFSREVDLDLVAHRLLDRFHAKRVLLGPADVGHWRNIDDTYLELVRGARAAHWNPPGKRGAGRCRQKVSAAEFHSHDDPLWLNG